MKSLNVFAFALLTILATQSLATYTANNETIKTDPQCIATVQAHSGLHGTTRKLELFSANRFGVEIDKYIFEVQISSDECSLLIRDPTNNASYVSLAPLPEEGEPLKLRLQLDGTQLILSCR